MADVDLKRLWKSAAGNITPLTEDPARFQEVYMNTFAEVGHKDKVLQQVVEQFEGVVVPRLIRNFRAHEDFDVLGVGVGEGPHEFEFLQRLAPHFPSIRNTAVDPSPMLGEFEAKVISCDAMKAFKCDWFNGRIEDFYESPQYANSKFNLITGSHVLYFTSDWERVLVHLLALLKKKGVLLLQVMSENNVFGKQLNEKPWLSGPNFHAHFPDDLLKVADRCGFSATDIVIPNMYDVTEIFDEESDFGSKVLDFLAQTSHFRETAPQKILEDVLEFWRVNSVSSDNNRSLSCADDHLLLFSKYEYT